MFRGVTGIFCSRYAASRDTCALRGVVFFVFLASFEASFGAFRAASSTIGISLPGTGESPAAPVFVDGEKKMTLRGERIAEEFQAIVLEYVKTSYGKKAVAA